LNPLELSQAIGALSEKDVRRASGDANRPIVMVRELAAHHRARLREHLLGLGEEDRLLRFGQVVADAVIEGYVDNIDFDHDKVFGVFDDHLDLIGAAHLAYLRESDKGKVAEFGVSVAESARGRGIGSAMFERAATHGRNNGVRTLYMHCLARNRAMMHIARKAGMKVHLEYGEADAYLELPPASPASHFAEALEEQVADLDYMLKRNVRNARRFGQRFWRTFTPFKGTA
jgi:RimJ/RimL family protein N-acetyltransferase